MLATARVEVAAHGTAVEGGRGTLGQGATGAMSEAARSELPAR